MKRFLRILAIAVLVVAAVTAALAALHRPLLNAAGRWLIVEDPLKPADVIVVLAGGVNDERVRQSATLYRKGYAPRVLLSGGGTTAGITISELQRRQAVQAGIPSSVLLFEARSTSTSQQARYLRPQLERLGVRRAIVVTSTYHARRTRYLFDKTFHGSMVDISIYPVQDDVYNPTEWWTREDDTERVILEYIKLVLAVLQ
jgi:uncharacterized SAM-binding protein YcdF (DUF218 family)